MRERAGDLLSVSTNYESPEVQNVGSFTCILKLQSFFLCN